MNEEEYQESTSIIEDELIEEDVTLNTSTKVETEDKIKLTELPLARVKRIMKSDPDCNLITKEAILLVTKSSEFFLALLARELKKTTLASKKKIVKMKDLDTVIDGASNLCFLDGMLN